MIIAKNLFKSFNQIKAVSDVSLTANNGKILGLLGPNGAGKSTTMRMLLNIITADSGEIFYDNKKWSVDLKNKIGYLPEERGLYQKNKILDVMVYMASLKNLQPQSSKKIIYEWLKRFEMLEVAKRKVEELSKGNQQKIQFIISLLHNPDYLILDEPFSGLDPVNQILLKEIMQEEKQKGKTIIFSTHQMDLAEKLCDEIILINKGEIILEGKISEIKNKFSSNNFKIEFFGDGNILKTINGIEKINLYENYAECEYSINCNLRDVINDLNNNLTIRKFELTEPSLNSIFISLVGGKEIKQ